MSKCHYIHVLAHLGCSKSGLGLTNVCRLCKTGSKNVTCFLYSADRAHAHLKKWMFLHITKKKKKKEIQLWVTKQAPICLDEKGQELKPFVQNHTLVFYACKFLLLACKPSEAKLSGVSILFTLKCYCPCGYTFNKIIKPSESVISHCPKSFLCYKKQKRKMYQLTSDTHWINRTLQKYLYHKNFSIKTTSTTEW